MKPLLIVLGVLLALLVLLALVRLRLRLEYGESGAALTMGLGPLPLLRLPAPRREKGSPGQKKTKRKKKETPEGKKTKGGSVPGFQDLLSIIGDVLGKLKRRLSIDELTLRFQSAAPDPADAALLFGASSAGAAGLVQVLEALFRVRKTDVRKMIRSIPALRRETFRNRLSKDLRLLKRQRSGSKDHGRRADPRL